MAETPLEFHSDPLSQQSKIYNEFGSRLAGDENAIVDTNTVFGFLVERISVETASIVQGCLNKFDSIYPKRGQTSADLYQHMSKYEYLGLFSYPSMAYITVMLDKSYLINHANLYTTADGTSSYKKAVIPASSIIKLGDYTFGMYYGIEIRINKDTDIVTIVYDTTADNSLSALSQNLVEHFSQSHEGLNVLMLKIPVYQFEVARNIETVSDETGFIKAYAYINRFYAAKVYNEKVNADGSTTWEEINQTLSENVYDIDTLTAKLVLYKELNQLKVTIPQIYFDNGMVGPRIKVEIYTTHGALDVDITELVDEQISATFEPQDADADTTYTNIFNHIPFLAVRPLSTRIAGGTNGYTFEELKRRVITGSFDDSDLITPASIDNHFMKKGFGVVKLRDGITERIYLCDRVLTDASEHTIGAAALPVSITSETLGLSESDELQSETIVDNDDGTFTLLPSTVFEYDEDTNITRIISDTEYAQLNTLAQTDKSAMCDAYNSHIYLRSPFHVKLCTDDTYPYAYSYDLIDPRIKNLNFVGENVYTATQLVVFNASITHLNDGIGGYCVDLIVSESADLAEQTDGVDNIDHDTDVKIYISYLTTTGVRIGTTAKYVGMIEGRRLYRFYIPTDYRINLNHDICYTTEEVDGETRGFQSLTGNNSNFGSLSPTMDIFFLLKNTYVSATNASSVKLGADVIPSDYDEYVQLAYQTIELELGSLAYQIYNSVGLSYSLQEYQTYGVTTYSKYANDVYKTDDVNPNIPAYTEDTVEVATTTATLTLDSPDIVVADATGLAVGQHVTDNADNIPYHARIINIDGTTVTLNKNATASATDLAIEVYSIVITLTIEHKQNDWIWDAINKVELTGVSTTADSYDIAIPATEFTIELGMSISCTGIPVGATVTGIDGSTLTLDKAATATAADAEATIGYPIIEHAATDNIINPLTGAPTLVTGRNIVYTVNIPLVDAKLVVSENPEHQNYLAGMASLMRDYFAVIEESRTKLDEVDKLYFVPTRTVGTATFQQDDDITIQLPLEIELGFKLHVPAKVYNSITTRDYIKKRVLAIVNEYITNDTISLTEIGNTIRVELADDVYTVDVMGINGDITLQTLIKQDAGTNPHIKQRLTFDTDGSVTIEHGVTVDFVKT